MFLCNSSTIATVQISAVIITFNEESNISAAIESVKWADEVVVVDSESTDKTREIAKSHGARVLVNPWPGFSAQKQFGADQSVHDWIFSLDADERVSKELVDEITALRGQSEIADGYSIPRLSFYLGRPVRHGGWYPDRQLRFFHRRKGRWNGAIVHESVRMDDASRVGKLKGDILHHTVESIEEHHRMIGDRYAPLGARQMFENGRHTSPLRAAAAGWISFIRSYFLRFGFLDGFAGFCIAYFAAHNSFMKHAILIELQQDKNTE